MVPSQLVDAGGKPFPEGVDEEIGPVTRQERLIVAPQRVRMPHQACAERVDGAPVEAAASVGGGDEDDAADLRNGLEEECLSQHLACLGRADEPIGGLSTEGLPEV